MGRYWRGPVRLQKVGGMGMGTGAGGEGGGRELRCHRQNDSASRWALPTGQDETPAF